MKKQRKPKRTKPANWVRLACCDCLRDDYDGITEAELEECRQTWVEVREVQSWHDSVTIWTAEQRQEQADRDDPRYELDWQTHEGLCPACQDSDDEDEPTPGELF